MAADRGAAGAAHATRLPLPDAIRGVAALLVAAHHFGSGLPLPEPLASIARHGWLGVDAFFVLSGFVIAALLLRGDTPLPAFLARRLVRLLPPCLAAFLLVELLDFASSLAPAYAGAAWQAPTWASVACHASLACDLFGLPWNNPVLWTLAVELQFYALAALLAVAATPARAAPRLLAALAVVGFLLLAGAAWFERYLPSFAIGAAAAAWRDQRIAAAPRLAFALLALAAAVALQDPAIAATACGVGVLLALRAAAPAPRILLGLGALSYSLYLVHAPVGGRVVNLLARLEPGPVGALAIAACALAAALLVAWALWRWVERPAIARARGIGERRPPDTATAGLA